MNKPSYDGAMGENVALGFELTMKMIALKTAKLNLAEFINEKFIGLMDHRADLSSCEEQAKEILRHLVTEIGNHEIEKFGKK